MIAVLSWDCFISMGCDSWPVPFSSLETPSLTTHFTHAQGCDSDWEKECIGTPSAAKMGEECSGLPNTCICSASSCLPHVGPSSIPEAWGDWRRTWSLVQSGDGVAARMAVQLDQVCWMFLNSYNFHGEGENTALTHMDCWQRGAWPLQDGPDVTLWP